LDPPAHVPQGGVTAFTAPKQPVILDPPSSYAPKKPLPPFDPPAPPGNGVALAATEPKQPVILDPPSYAPKKPVPLPPFDPPAPPGNGVAFAAPKKPAILSPPREPTGWKAAAAEAKAPRTLLKSAEDATAAAPENSTGVALAVQDPSAAPEAEAPVALSTENSTGAAVAVQNPTDHSIHDQIAETHKSMCEDGRMDSDHCAKFRGALDGMEDEIKDIHDDHTAKMMDQEAAAEEPKAEPETTVESVNVEVESVKEHEPVITKHEYPYKTGPCAGATAVALIFSGLLFA